MHTSLAPSEDTRSKGMETKELEDLLREIDRSGVITPDALGDPGDFLLRIYATWKKNGGLKERKKNRNSYNQMCEWLSGDKRIKSFQQKLQGLKHLNKGDIKILLNLFFEKWRFVELDMNDGEANYVAFDSDDTEKLVSLISSELLRSSSGTIKFASSSEYVDSAKDVHLVQRRMIGHQYVNANCTYCYKQKQHSYWPRTSNGISWF